MSRRRKKYPAISTIPLFRIYLSLVYSKRMKTSLDLHMARIAVLFAFASLVRIPLIAQQNPSPTQPFPSTFDTEFPKGDALRNITEPVFLGKTTFLQRLGEGGRIQQSSPTPAPQRPPLGLVLCGGSARAYAHIGVLKALEKAGIYPDFIVASSMGAIVGMLYASGYSPDDIQMLLHAIPLESYFNIVIPTNGGLINTEIFRATLRKLIGKLDLSETEIPIIVTAEDLKFRQQIWIAEGPFDRVMTSAFAMPAIFEPQPFDNFELIDAGATIIAPVEPALQLSDRLIISTAFYDRTMNFSSPITVLNRAVDIGKTRVGMEEIQKSNAFVIRNDVENLSYMQFSDPDIIISKGEQSATAALEKLNPDVRSHLENSPPSDFFEHRSRIHDSLIRTIRQLQSGEMPSASFMMRGVPILRLLEPFSRVPGETGTEPCVGASLAFSISKLRAGISYFSALGPEPGKEWAVETGIRANPIGSLNLWLTTRLWGVYGSTYILDHKPEYWEFSGLVKSTTALQNNKIGFQLGGDVFLTTMGAVATWQTLGLVEALSTQKFSKTGALLQPWYSAEAGAFVENTSGAQIAAGIQSTLMGGLRSTWITPKARAFAKVSLNGQEFAESKFDGFRSSASRGSALSDLITNIEIAVVLRDMYLDMAEALLCRNFELAPFFDTRWSNASGENFHMSDWATGLSFSFEARAFGLAPATISLYGSYTGSKVFTLQIRTGVLLSGQ
jgi:NTE family protein